MRRLIFVACLCLLPIMGQAQEQKSITMPAKGDFMMWCIPDLAKSLGVADQLESDKEIFGKTVLFCQCELEKMPAEGEQAAQGVLNSATQACAAEMENDGWDVFSTRYVDGAKQTFDSMPDEK